MDMLIQEMLQDLNGTPDEREYAILQLGMLLKWSSLGDDRDNYNWYLPDDLLNTPLASAEQHTLITTLTDEYHRDGNPDVLWGVGQSPLGIPPLLAIWAGLDEDAPPELLHELMSAFIRHTRLTPQPDVIAGLEAHNPMPLLRALGAHPDEDTAVLAQTTAQTIAAYIALYKRENSG